MNYKINQTQNGKYEIVDLKTGESSGPRYRTVRAALQIAANLQAEDDRIEGNEK